MIERYLLAWMLLGMALDVYTTLRIPIVDKMLAHIKLRELNPTGVFKTTVIKPVIIILALYAYLCVDIELGILFMGVFGAMWLIQGFNNVLTFYSAFNFNETIGELKLELSKYKKDEEVIPNPDNMEEQKYEY